MKGVCNLVKCAILGNLWKFRSGTFFQVFFFFLIFEFQKLWSFSFWSLRIPRGIWQHMHFHTLKSHTMTKNERKDFSDSRFSTNNKKSIPLATLTIIHIKCWCSWPTISYSDQTPCLDSPFPKWHKMNSFWSFCSWMSEKRVQITQFQKWQNSNSPWLDGQKWHKNTWFLKSLP